MNGIPIIRSRALARGVALLMILCALSAGRAAHAQGAAGLSYREFISLESDGSAAVTVTLELGSEARRMLLPTHGEDVSALVVRQPAGAAATVQNAGGQAWILIDLPESAAGRRAVIISFLVHSSELLGGTAPHDSRRSTLRFRNATGSAIGAYSAVLRLPSGLVVASVDEVEPPAGESSGRAPYALGADTERRTVEILSRPVGPGEEFRLELRLRRPASNIVMNLILAAACVAYLIRFRDLLRKPADVDRSTRRVA